jgi:membrane protein YdbS with pleckstrin-like domain
VNDHAADQPERLIVEARRHWLSAGFWWRLVLVLVVLGVTMVLLLPGMLVPPLATGLGLGLLALNVLAVVFLLFIPFIQWRSRVYRLTDRRLILEEGIVTRRSKSIPLARLQDVTSVIGPLGRLFNYGSLQVENAGESPGFDLLPDIPDPARFRELLLEHAAEARSAGP